MINFRSFLTTENVLLFAFMLLAEAAGTLFIITTNEAPAGFDLLRLLGYTYAVGYWLEVDSRARDFEWPHCRGVFLHLVWPLLASYYLFKTRGVRAFLTLLIFGGMYAFSLLVGLVAATLLVAPRFD